MRLWKAWIIARKEMAFVRTRRSLFSVIIALPILLGVMLPLVVYYVMHRRQVPVPFIENLMGSFGYYFVIIGALLPLYIAVSSIVVEKLEKSLEPLLATPTTEGEILIGKNIATFLPTILSLYAGAVVFVILMDAVTYGAIGYLFFPNWTFAVALFLAAPLACIFSTAFGVFASSRVTSVQSAQSLGLVPLVPMIVIYLLGELSIISLNSITNLLIIAGCLLVVDVFTFELSIATFSRDKILTRWK